MTLCRINSDIELRLLEPAHTEELFLLTDRNRQHLRQWLPWLDGNTAACHSGAFIESARKAHEENNGFVAGIFVNRQLAGTIGLHGVDWTNRKTSIGYWLGKEYEGKGVMTRSCQALVDHVFREMKLNRVEIRAAVENLKSRAVPERLGFKQEGTLREMEWLYDHYVDHVVYSMLSRELKS